MNRRNIKIYNEWGGWKYLGHLWGSPFGLGSEWAENDADRLAMTNYYGGNVMIYYLLNESNLSDNKIGFMILNHFSGTFTFESVIEEYLFYDVLFSQNKDYRILFLLLNFIALYY